MRVFQGWRTGAVLLLAVLGLTVGAGDVRSDSRWGHQIVVGPSKPIWTFTGDPLAVGENGSVFAAWRKRYQLEGRWISPAGRRGPLLSLAAGRAGDPTIVSGPGDGMFLAWQPLDAGQWLRTWSRTGTLGPEREITSDYGCVSMLMRAGNYACLHAPSGGTTGVPFLLDVFAPDGSLLSSSVVANPPEADVGGTAPGSLAAGPHGDVVVTWSEANARCCDGRSFARVVHADGSRGPVLDISGRATPASPVVDQAGRIAFFFDTPVGGLRVRHRVRWFGRDGSPLGRARNVSTPVSRGGWPVRLGRLGNGSVLAVWEEPFGPRDSSGRVMARIVAPQRSGPLRVISSPSDRYSLKANLATSRGAVYVIWLFLRSEISGAAKVGLKLRSFTPDGRPDQVQTLVPVGKAGYSPMPHIDGNRRGDLAVLYKSKAGMAVKIRRR